MFDQHVPVVTEHNEPGFQNRKPWNNISAERAQSSQEFQQLRTDTTCSLNKVQLQKAKSIPD